MTLDWTGGYVADVGYTYGYYSELNPLHAKMALLNAGLMYDNYACYQGVHCELGYGQGVSANIHAAASGSTWYGNDFNPSQAIFAKSLAQISGSKVYLSDESFDMFCNRAVLPEFDSIGLHGIWSWISDNNRQVIIDFVQRKLKVGGLLYVSYNTLPGWSSFAPVRHLLSEHASVMGSTGSGTLEKVKSALSFTQKLMDTSPLYARSNPKALERLQKISTQDPNYLAHEYFNRDWQPMYFSSMAEQLAKAKLSYACSAHYLDQVDPINLSGEKLNFLQNISDPIFKETVRDFMVNQNFRRDYWIKGPRKLNNVQQYQALREQKIVLNTHSSNVSLKARGALGEATMNDAIYQPLLEKLADHKPITVGELEIKVGSQPSNFGNLNQAILVLAGTGVLSSVQDDASIDFAQSSCRELNTHLIEQSKATDEISYLGSPLTGGGISVNRFEKLFLASYTSGKTSLQEIAESTWYVVSSQGQKIKKEGKTLATDEENISAISEQANDFLIKKLPILKELRVI